MPGDWAKRTARAVSEYGEAPASRPRFKGSDFYGSSQDFNRWLRHRRPNLVVPESEIVPLTGDSGWSPEHESALTDFCPSCHELIRTEAAEHAALKLHRIGWTLQPDGSVGPVESRHPVGCPFCRGRIQPGSRLYCPKCQASGYETQLAAQRGIVGRPPAETGGSR